MKFNEVNIDQLPDAGDGNLRRSWGLSGEKQPDMVANNSLIAQKLGKPLALVEAVPKLGRDQRFKEIDAALEKAPVSRKFLHNPDYMAQAHDDVETLSGIEALFTPVADVARSGVGGIFDSIGMGVEGAGRLVQAGGNAVDDVLGSVLPESAMNVLRYPDMPWWTDPALLLRWEGSGLKSSGKAIGAPEERQNLATDIAGGVGQMVGQISMALINPAIGGANLFAQGVDQQGDKQEAAGMEGKSDIALLAGGGVTAITEKFGLDKMLDRVAPGVKNKILRNLTDVFIAGGYEAAQEVVEGIGQNLVEYAFYNPKAEIFTDFSREALAAGGSGAIMRGIVNAVAPGRTRINSDADAKKVDALLKGYEDSKLTGRNSGLMQEFMKKIGKGKSVFIDPNEAEILFQSGMPEGVEQSESVQAFIDRIPGAIESGQRIEVTLDEMVELSRAGLARKLQPHMTIDPEALTPTELKNEDVQKKVKELKGSITSEKAEDRVFNDVLGQLLGTKTQDRSSAEVNAGFHVGIMKNFADKVGVTVDQLAEKYGLKIKGEIDESLKEKAEKIEDIDVLLNRVRDGDLPKDQDIFGQSLMSFIRANGGLVDNGGELSARDIKSLYRKDGNSLDGMAELAAEQGYIAERSESALIEAIDREHKGEYVSKQGQEDAELLRLRDELAELETILADAGIDIQALSNSEIKNMLLGPSNVGGTTLSQNQDFGDVSISETVEVEGTQDSVIIKESAQRKFDQAVKRRKVIDKISRCMRGS